jgi:hypothetical protein
MAAAAVIILPILQKLEVCYPNYFHNMLTVSPIESNLSSMLY